MKCFRPWTSTIVLAIVLHDAMCAPPPPLADNRTVIASRRERRSPEMELFGEPQELVDFDMPEIELPEFDGIFPIAAAGALGGTIGLGLGGVGGAALAPSGIGSLIGNVLPLLLGRGTGAAPAASVTPDPTLDPASDYYSYEDTPPADPNKPDVASASPGEPG